MKFQWRCPFCGVELKVVIAHVCLNVCLFAALEKNLDFDRICTNISNRPFYVFEKSFVNQLPICSYNKCSNDLWERAKTLGEKEVQCEAAGRVTVQLAFVLHFYFQVLSPRTDHQIISYFQLTVLFSLLLKRSRKGLVNI